MKKLLGIVAAFTLLTVILVGCKKDKPVEKSEVDEPKPTANFTVERDTVNYLKYKFTNTSANYTEFLWQFGDDSTSYEKAPTHKFTFDGTYHVLLTTRNGQGYTANKELILKIKDPNFDDTKVGENYFLTIGGKLTVTKDNEGGPNAGEGSSKLVDGNSRTKFFQNPFQVGLVMKYELNTPAVPGAYTLVSADDSDPRDPSAWTFQASEDNVRWITLDTQSGIKFPGRFWQRRFYPKTITAYKFYRITINAINGNGGFQLAEWSVNKKQP